MLINLIILTFLHFKYFRIKQTTTIDIDWTPCYLSDLLNLHCYILNSNVRVNIIIYFIFTYVNCVFINLQTSQRITVKQYIYIHYVKYTFVIIFGEHLR